MIVAVPLLVETGFQRFVSRVLVVDCPAEVQISRLMRRDGLSEAEAADALSAQATREERLAIADDVIDNSGELGALDEQVQGLHATYLILNPDCPKPEGRAE